MLQTVCELLGLVLLRRDGLALNDELLALVLIVIGVILICSLFLVVFLAIAEHIIVHVVTLGLEVATQGDLSALRSALEEQLELLGAVDVQVELGDLASLRQHCEGHFLVLELLLEFDNEADLSFRVAHSVKHCC